MNSACEKKVQMLSRGAGVYLFRDKVSRVIYVGKAVNLKNRVSSYFNNQLKDLKTEELVKNIVKIDTIETSSEFEALILESDLVKRYKPKYNIRLRDDKSYVYLKFTKEDYPRISIVRQVTGEAADYLGPFIDPRAVRDILKIVRKIYPYCSCSQTNDEICLFFHLGLCPGHSAVHITKADYAKNVRGIKKLFAGRTNKIKKEFQKEMKLGAKGERFERAKDFRDKLRQLERIERSHFISDRDLAADVALVQLQKALNLPQLPARIECYDISNIMGTAAVGSMVVFKDGIASPKDYRRFQIRTVKGSNDFAMLAEVLNRRFKTDEKLNLKNEKDNLKLMNSDLIRNSKPARPAGGLKNLNYPDLIILDGGKGQLSTILKSVEIPAGIKVVALAKRLEELHSATSDKQSVTGFRKTILKEKSESYFLVQRIRDEAHRFAITYHRKVKSREMYETSLDAIPGVGPKTKKKLLREFGSIQKIKGASAADLAVVVGNNLAKKIKESL